ncbi:TMP-TENI-domain-containing protein [Xylariomycetidae sp. FL2044]|nr:TMP-TENI-domain-containing protein [Xylariomycetidae sp. FL2044]
MDVKQIQIVQNNHAERLSRLEKRHADDAAIKSVWDSPFPSPVQIPPSEMFDDFEEQGQNLLGSLHLDAEDEPTRRGAASRANSVRFDESALQSSSWAHNGRHSGDFGPIRPGSGLGSHAMMERSLSHKSDGRHSSAGHSVHSIHSHHSVASGRGSSLGLNTTFTPGGNEDDSPVGMPEPPPGLFVLGSVPAIIRCWLTANFAHDTLLYADICTGSQKSVIEFSLIKEVGLVDAIHRDLDGVHRIRLDVYLTEATVAQPSSRVVGSAPQIPSLTCTFEITGMDQPDTAEAKKAIRIFIGSEALREHSADVLFSQNRMTLYSSEREKLLVPFVRPEDSGVFKNVRTMAVFPEKPKLNATARPFILGESKPQLASAGSTEAPQPKVLRLEHEPLDSPSSEQTSQPPGTAETSAMSESGGECERQHKETKSSEAGSTVNGIESKESAPLSGYQPPGRTSRNMKVLKPLKKDNVDYSLYLVTDSTPAILGDKDICAVVESALQGGVTCVQYRDKTSDTSVLVDVGRRLHVLTKKHGVPLLINDRLDVALAVGCEGVHIGQDDVDLPTARRILGEDAIIGVTVSNAEETEAACKGGADYLGIGTVFATPTKENTKSIIGVDGLQQILHHIAALNSPVKTVCIGGINASNVSRVTWQSSAKGRSLDGVAVVSAIMAAEDPMASAKKLAKLVQAPPNFASSSVSPDQQTRSVEEILAIVPEIISAVDRKKPLSHNMTNLVVQNFAANVALSVGASPIMANYGEEAKDLASLGGALVINMGTVTPDGLTNYLKALAAYNNAGQPVVFDPVGAGATAVRRSATKTILGGGYINVLKGNQSEILSCIPGGAEIQQRGVDSGPGEPDAQKLGSAIKELATLQRNVVVMTGKTDYVTAGQAVYTVDNGHEYLGMVTGTGCCLGTTISAMIAAYPEDVLAATLTGLLFYGIAAEDAAGRGDVKGPGTFVPAFIDELYKLRKATVGGDLGWLKRARVSVLP